MSHDTIIDLEQEGFVSKEYQLGLRDKSLKRNFLTVPREMFDIHDCSEEELRQETQFSV